MGHEIAVRSELATLQERYECNTAIMHARTESLAVATRELAETKSALALMTRLADGHQQDKRDAMNRHADAVAALEASRAELSETKAALEQYRELLKEPDTMIGEGDERRCRQCHARVRT